jgi:hypothetical protein
LCCDNRCVEHDAENCTACGEGCSVTTGGLFCENTTDTPEGPWQCECNDSDAMCRGQYDFSRAECNFGLKQCVCDFDELDQPFMCEGTVTDMCCFVGDKEGCTNLLDDEFNCGICNSVCESGQECVNGACGCATTGTCPANTGAPDCLNDNCVCSENGEFPNYEPCPVGQYCCSEGVNQPIGCCLRECAISLDNGNSCSFYCEEPQVWTENGCE